MLKIFILCIISCAATARPSYLSPAVALPRYEHYAYEPTLVGHAIGHLPTAVSHQSQTIVHEKRPYLRKIWDYQPAAAYVRAHYAPAPRKLVATAPALAYAPAPALAYAPASYATELYPSGWATGLSYPSGWNGWPLK